MLFWTKCIEQHRPMIDLLYLSSCSLLSFSLPVIYMSMLMYMYMFFKLIWLLNSTLSFKYKTVHFRISQIIGYFFTMLRYHNFLNMNEICFFFYYFIQWYCRFTDITDSHTSVFKAVTVLLVVLVVFSVEYFGAFYLSYYLH